MLAPMLIAVATLIAAEPRELRGKVVHIADGDTITVLDAERVEHKVRLSGIDAPEKKQAFGNRSRQALQRAVDGKEVLVKWTEHDRYKRILGDVYLGEEWINKRMITDGLAWHYTKFDKRKELADAEAQARKHHKGLWIDKEPIPPWEFRHPMQSISVNKQL